MKLLYWILWFTTVSLVVPSCASVTPSTKRPSYPVSITETAILELPLTGRLANPKIEISAMAWHGDTLVLMPQYPSCTANKDAMCALTLERQDILARIDGNPEPLEAQELVIEAEGLAQSIRGFEGFEGLAIIGDQVFIAVEARPSPIAMMGWLVPGTWTDQGIILRGEERIQIQPASGLLNKTDEALVGSADGLLTIHEINGSNHNPSPQAHQFGLDLQLKTKHAFPPIEYRITDGTQLDADRRFWIMSYQWSGDVSLQIGEDPVFRQFGTGKTHALSNGIERLIELQLTDAGITTTKSLPVIFELGPASRNWEGLVRLGTRGFLVVTDQHPTTILGFVPYPP